MKPHGSGIKREPPAIAGRPPKKYTWLSEDRHCDVCVTGGGLTGAMCALFAAEAGLSAVLITSEGIGFGDTGHLTGCARFDAGRTLSGLDRIMSVDDALKLYSLGLDALDGLENLCGALDGTYKKSGVSSGFERRDLLVFTDTPTELALMESEYLAIRKKLPQCTFVTRKTAESSFGFPVSGGLMTSGGSAVLDPYLLAHMCLMRAEELGAEIFEQTAATDIQTPGSEDGCVIITTSTHRHIYADRLIWAAGSRGTQILPLRARPHALFAMTARLPADVTGWAGQCTLGKYGRGAEGCSLTSGGKLSASCTCRNGFFRRVGASAKFNALRSLMQSVLPDFPEACVKYQYAYAFETPSDGLPVIGTHGGSKNCLFALPGLYHEAGAPVFSFIAAQTAAAFLTDQTYKSNPLFDPMR